jgi:hypothetical protein
MKKSLRPHSMKMKVLSGKERTRAAVLPSIDIYFHADDTYYARNKSWKSFVPLVGNNQLSRRAHRSLGAE